MRHSPAKIMKKIIQAEMVKNGGSVPLSLLNQVVVGTDGKIEKFVQLANVENTRLIGIIAEKTRGRTESYSSESAQAKADRIRHATDTQDKFTVQSGKNFQNGKIDSDDAIFEGQPIGWRGFVNRRNRMVASERAESAGLRVAAEQPVLVKSRIENADSRDINLIIDAWKDAKPALFETDSELAKALAAAGTDIGKQREALYRTFQGTPQNEKNRLVPAIDGLISKSI